MILVIGGTGTVGSLVLERLSSGGHETRAFVRSRPDRVDPALPMVEIVHGDALDAGALRGAMTGARAVFLCVGNGPMQEAAEMAVVEAATRVRVDRLVKLSAPVFEPDAPVAIAALHGRVERAIEASGLRYTFLRPYAFMQNLENQLMPLRVGVLPTTMRDVAFNIVDARDVAEVAVAALAQDGHANRAYALTGARAVTYEEIADALSDLTLRPIRALHKDAGAYAAELTGVGLPPWVAQHIVEIERMAAAVQQHPTSAVRDILDRPPRAIEKYLPDLAAKLNGGPVRRPSMPPVQFEPRGAA